MSKRPASYDIDEHTYEEKQKAREGDDQIDDEARHMANRKIYKVRKGDESAPRVSTGNGAIDFKLKGTIDNNDVKPPSLGVDIKLPENPFKLNMNNQSEGVGLFSNIFSNPSGSAKPALFGKDSKQPAKPPTLGGGSLFGDKKPDNNGGLFSNTTSIFGSNSNSLFSNNNSSSILFGGSTNLFGNAPSLFGNLSKGPITAPPEEDSGDSQELEKDQEMVADPTKSTARYDYGAQDGIIRKIAVNKYKKDKGNLVESVEAIIKLDSEKGIYYLIIRLPTTKNVIFTGILFPRRSAVKRNEDNLDILAYSFGEKKELEAHRIKLQIKGLDNELGSFYYELQQIIEGKSVKKNE